MNTDYIDAFKKFKFLKLQDIYSLSKICSFKSFQKGEFLAKEGEYCPSTFLIRKGIIRTYVLTPDGEERTIRLAREKEFISPRESFMHGRASNEFLEAVEECKVIMINTKKLEELSRSNSRILRMQYVGILEAFYEATERIEFFTIYTPEQRYHYLLEKSPDLLQRVPQKYLASYIGVTTVSLSRIRNRK